MQNIIIEGGILDRESIRQALLKSCDNRGKCSKVLLIPPDITRLHSGAGLITSLYYEIFTKEGISVDILPALGSHVPVTREEQLAFFGDIPEERFLVHNWRDGVTTLGEISSSYVREVSEGLVDTAIPVQVSKYLADPSYDRIISIGQVVPHEVVGMANYTKNIVVGCGGSKFISASHILGAFYGVERVMGQVDTPTRKLFDYAEEHFISKIPVEYVLTVTVEGKIIGLYIGSGRELFERASALSQKKNIVYVDRPIRQCVAYLDELEFHSLWLGNKAVYRTRMAMADGGDLLVLAPAVKTFGEDEEVDRLIRKYGYVGREKLIQLCNNEPELKQNLSAAAHMIFSSSDGRFSITYAAPQMGREAIESVGYKYMDWDEAISLYDHKKLKPGYNGPQDKEVYYIPNAALGLWQVKK